MRGRAQIYALLLPLGLLLLVTGGCKPQRLGPIPCTSTSQCPSHHVCNKTSGFCIAARSCKELSDCCPGQKCFNGLCTNLAECNETLTCIGDDRLCVEGICRRKACQNNSDCTFPNGCVYGVCMPDIPCEGKCAADQVCLSPLDRCFPKSRFCPEISCPPGEIPVVSNGYDQIGYQCQEAANGCSCQKSPAIPPGKFGPYARIAIDGTTPVVAAYDKTYGDLVFVTMNNKYQPVSIAYVDGVPSTGTVVYDPAGPRNGIIDVGDDVGLELSMTTDGNGHIAIAYYDRTHRNLKLAYRTQAGATWTVVTVDSDVAAGRFCSITQGAGKLHISYFVEESGDGRTGLRYAQSKTLTPSGSSDFTLSWIDSGPKPAVSAPCQNACMNDQVCVRVAEKETCKVPTPSACGFCGPGTACVDGECLLTLTAQAEIDRFPLGKGLWSSVALLPGGGLAVSYYDSLNGNLLLANGNLTSGFTIRVLDGKDAQGADTGDVGRYTSLAIRGDGTLGIAYQDGENGWLKFWSGAIGSAGSISIVDQGADSEVRAIVGADAKLLFGPDGEPRIAYQDQTFNDLKYAVRSGQSWQLKRLMEEGAVGYYVDQTTIGSNALVSTLEIKLSDTLQISYILRITVVPF